MSTVDAAIINHITNGGSSGGGGSGVSYTAGDAISLANNQISVQYDSNTMELINGKLSAKSGSSGGGGSSGNVPTEDVFERGSAYQSGNFISDSILKLNIGADNKRAQNGNQIRLKNRSGQIKTFMFMITDKILYTDDHPTTFTNSNATIYDENGIDYNAYIYRNGQDYFVLISCESGSFEEYGENDTDVGMFIITQMSYSTLVKLINNMFTHIN